MDNIRASARQEHDTQQSLSRQEVQSSQETSKVLPRREQGPEHRVHRNSDSSLNKTEPSRMEFDMDRRHYDSHHLMQSSALDTRDDISPDKAIDSDSEPTGITPAVREQIISKIVQNVLQQLTSHQEKETAQQTSDHLYKLGTDSTLVSDIASQVSNAPPSPAISRSSSLASSRSRSPPRTAPEGPVMHPKFAASHLSTAERRILERTWGKLFEAGQPTIRFEQFLRGLAAHIIENDEPRHSLIIPPHKMQAFYHKFKVPNEVLPWHNIFDQKTSSISRLYREFGVEHHLIQESTDSRPDVPALTPKGFATWNAIIIRAFPDLEFQRLSIVVSKIPISSPDDTNERYPQDIERHMLPESADQMLKVKLEIRFQLLCHVRLELPEGTDGSSTETRETSQRLKYSALRRSPMSKARVATTPALTTAEILQQADVSESVAMQIESDEEVPQSGATSTHVTWTCSCGTELSDCYTELEPGSIATLQTWLREQTTSQPFVSPDETAFTATDTVSDASQAGQSSIVTDTVSTSQSTAVANVSAANRPEGQSKLESNTPIGLTTAGKNSSSTVPSNGPLITYLLLCIPEGLSGLKLKQQQLLRYILGRTPNSSPNTVTNDRELFQLLRKSYRAERRLFFSSFWPKAVIRVSLAHFLVDMSEYIELKHYGCVGVPPETCRCIPPIDLLQPSPQAQYACQPREPRFKPPIGTNYLTHYFQNEGCIKSDKVVFVLNQLPKRMGECLVASGMDRLEAWGLEFEEGWDRGRLRNVVFAILITGCLVFAITWTIVEKDAQSAFTIAAFFVTIFVLVGGYTASVEPRIVHK